MSNPARSTTDPTFSQLPVRDPGELAVDLIRLAAEVLECGGRLEVLNRSWVDRHVTASVAKADKVEVASNTPRRNA